MLKHRPQPRDRRRRSTAVIVLHGVLSEVYVEQRTFQRRRFGFCWTEEVDYYLVPHCLILLRSVIDSLAYHSEVIFSTHARFALSDLQRQEAFRDLPREQFVAVLRVLKESQALARVHLDPSLGEADELWAREICESTLGSFRIIEPDDLVYTKTARRCWSFANALGFFLGRFIHTYL